MDRITPLPTLGFTEAVKESWSKLTQVKGRARRSEFWWTYLAIVLACLVVSWIPIIHFFIPIIFFLIMIPLTFRRLHDTGRSGWWYIVYIILSIIWNIAIFSNIFLALWRAVAANANMDDAFSGSIFSMFFPPHIIICFIMTAIYGIILLIFLCQDSQPYDNKYGPSPKYVAEGNESDIPDNVPAWEPEDRWN